MQQCSEWSHYLTVHTINSFITLVVLLKEFPTAPFCYIRGPHFLHLIQSTRPSAHHSETERAIGESSGESRHLQPPPKKGGKEREKEKDAVSRYAAQ